MSSSSVWIQLYYEGSNKAEGQPVEIEPIPKNIGALAKEVKKELSVALNHCDTAMLAVYPPGTTPPYSKKTFIRGDKLLRNLIDELGDKNPRVSIGYDHPLVVVAPAQKQHKNQANGKTQTLQNQFRTLLEGGNVKPNEEVMKLVVQHFASSATLADTPEQAVAIYNDACLLPRSATQIALKDKGISVAGVFRGSDPSKAVLLHAYCDGSPHILKIATDKSISHEYEVWSAVEATNPQSDTYLVPLKKLAFESVTIEVGDVFGGSSVHAPCRCGVLMKHYQGTLSQCKIPLTAEVLLRYGRYLQKAISSLHQAGYCHLDIKPSNIFLFEGACYLGDFGAAVKPGDPIHERTIKYYPKDGGYEANKTTDFYLLAMTLLEMFGAIPMASQRDSLTKEEIHAAIGTVGDEEVKRFLKSLLES